MMAAVTFSLWVGLRGLRAGNALVRDVRGRGELSCDSRPFKKPEKGYPVISNYTAVMLRDNG